MSSSLIAVPRRTSSSCASTDQTGSSEPRSSTSSSIVHCPIGLRRFAVSQFVAGAAGHEIRKIRPSFACSPSFQMAPYSSPQPLI